MNVQGFSSAACLCRGCKVWGRRGGVKRSGGSTAYQGVADVHGRHAVAPAAAAPSKSSHATPQPGARPADFRGQGGERPRILPRHWRRMPVQRWRGLQHTQLLAGAHVTAIHVINQQNSSISMVTQPERPLERTEHAMSAQAAGLNHKHFTVCTQSAPLRRR